MPSDWGYKHKPFEPVSYDDIDFSDRRQVQQARDSIIREQWIKTMEQRLVRDELAKCYKAEGVNHYVACKDLAEREYLLCWSRLPRLDAIAVRMTFELVEVARTILTRRQDTLTCSRSTSTSPATPLQNVPTREHKTPAAARSIRQNQIDHLYKTHLHTSTINACITGTAGCRCVSSGHNEKTDCRAWGMTYCSCMSHDIMLWLLPDIRDLILRASGPRAAQSRGRCDICPSSLPSRMPRASPLHPFHRCCP